MSTRRGARPPETAGRTELGPIEAIERAGPRGVCIGPPGLPGTDTRFVNETEQAACWSEHSAARTSYGG